MTPAQRKKLAKAARELAMECVAGTAPQFGTWRLADDHGNPICAIGHLYFRFHGTTNPPSCLVGMFSKGDLLPALEAVVDGNNESRPDERHFVVAVPLLWLADELESAP